MAVGQLEAHSNEHKREDDPDQRGQEEAAAAQPLHQEHAGAAGGQVGGRDDGRRPDGRLGRVGADAGHADNGGRVVHEGVDASGLLEDLEAAADGQGTTRGTVLQTPGGKSKQIL